MEPSFSAHSITALVVQVCDIRQGGLTSQELAIARAVSAVGKPIVVAANMVRCCAAVLCRAVLCCAVCDACVVYRSNL